MTNLQSYYVANSLKLLSYPRWIDKYFINLKGLMIMIFRLLLKNYGLLLINTVVCCFTKSQMGIPPLYYWPPSLLKGTP